MRWLTLPVLVWLIIGATTAGRRGYITHAEATIPNGTAEPTTYQTSPV
jgi:hypothetical protein